MRPTLVPIADPVARVTDRADWMRQARDAWPDAPSWLLGMVVNNLVHPDATPDSPLLLADGLEEARSVASAEGRVATAAPLKRLADLPRRAAAMRAASDRAAVAPDDAAGRSICGNSQGETPT